MIRRTTLAAVLLLIGVAPPLGVGCNSSAPAPSQAAVESIPLRELGELYRNYVLDKKAPPKTLADVQPYEAAFPTAMARLRAGELQVFWGGELLKPDAVYPGEVSSDTVLAFETKVPNQGGYVLLANREIKTLTPDQFKSAPKAGGSASSDGKARPKS
jgi:hypothetical protein